MMRSPEVVVDIDVRISATPASVFAFVTDHARLPRWAPALRRVVVDDSRSDTPGGAGTIRTLYPKLGAPGVEIVLEYRPSQRLVYAASDESLRGLCTEHRTTISLEPSDDGECTLRWTVQVVPPNLGGFEPWREGCFAGPRSAVVETSKNISPERDHERSTGTPGGYAVQRAARNA